MNSQASKKKRPPVHTGLIIRYYAELYKMDGSMFARRGYLLSFSSQHTTKVIINITHDIHKNIIFAVEKNAKFSNRAKQAVLRCRITE